MIFGIKELHGHSIRMLVQIWRSGWDSTCSAEQATSGCNMPPAYCQVPSGSNPCESLPNTKSLPFGRDPVFGGVGGIRTHVPVRANGFRDRPVMTASIPLRMLYNISGRRFVRRPEKKWRRHPDLNRSNRGFAVRCLTTWLWRHWSGQRDSNSLPPPWQGGALPNELCPQMVPQARIELATRGFSVRCSTY